MTTPTPREITADHASASGCALAQTERGRSCDPLRHRAHVAAWISRNPEKRRAHNLLRNALRRREMERGCCHCGAPGEAHHHDYSRPLDVVFLCRRHHAAEHRKAGAR